MTAGPEFWIYDHSHNTVWEE